MHDLEAAKVKAAATYNSASNFFDHPANSFWDRFGQTTINRLNLQAGQAVLDVCCGAGASALPAAEAVGKGGRVVGIDLAENLLQLARNKAEKRGLTQVEFKQGDMMSIDPADALFDSVVCVFGIFFVPDMPAAVRVLWSRVKPGGKLAITTWGEDFFEPANTAFWKSIQREAPSLHKSFNPWDRISQPSSLAEMLSEAGIESVEIEEQRGIHPINSPEDWWTTLIGTGYRGTIDQLDASSLARVKQANLEFIEQADIKGIAANVIYAMALKPSE